MFPLFCLAFALIVTPAQAADNFWQKLTWNTPDGVVFVGLYHPAQRPGANTWILLHGLGSTKSEWETFAKKLGRQGDGSFIYDARGHHESNKTVNGTRLDYKDWKVTGPGTPWDMMVRDLGTAVELLKTKHQIPENRIALGGASLGANVALAYAGQHTVVPALILLSPGIDYAAIQSPVPYKAYQGHPIFIAASPDDRYAYASVQQLASLASSSAQTLEVGNKGHGVTMLDEPFTRKLLSWVKSLSSKP